MRSWREFWCGALLGVVGLLGGMRAWALDPAKELSQYHMDLWTERDGLPQASVHAITQTRDGYLWIGTRDGLARFDGVTFTVFTAENAAGLESNDIRALYEDKQGTLWIGTFNGGVSLYREGRFQSFSRKTGLPITGVLTICQDKSGDIWLGGWDGVVRHRRGSFHLFGSADGLFGSNGWSICEDARGRLFVSTERGVNILENDRFAPFAPEKLQNHSLRQAYAGRQGVFWLATLGRGLMRMEGENVTYFTTANGLADDNVRTVLEDSDGNLWVGTWRGLSRIQDGKVSSLKRESGFPNEIVESLFEDKEGSLWIGLRGGGLARLKEGKFSVYTTKQGLGDNFAKCVLEGRDGAIWIGTDGGGLSRYKDGQFKNYPRTERGIAVRSVRSLAEDAEGNIWAGSAQPARVCVVKNGMIEIVFSKKEIPIETSVRVLFFDREGNLWIGGDGEGLCRYAKGVMKVFTAADGLAGLPVRTVMQDRAGTIWVGTNDGLCRFADGKFTTFTTANGLAHNAVYAILQDAEGDLWLGTQGGLSRYRDGSFHAYTARDGLFQNLIFSVFEDGENNLWMSSNHGVFTIHKRELDAFDRGKAKTLRCTVYGIADGMTTSQCQGGSQPAGWKARSGRLWFPTTRGVATILPGKVKRNNRPPPVLIEKVMAQNQELTLTQTPVLDSGLRGFSFHYTALSFLAPEKVRFKYRLDGVDRDWVEADGRRVAYYNEIPHGHHVFRVIACNNDGVWNHQGASFAFTLPPHFYETIWFYALCAAALALGAWRFHRWQLKEARAEFSLVLEERGRIARELHDTLAQGFAGIAFQLEAVATKLFEAPQQAQEHLNLALTMVRHSLGEARRSVMNLRPSSLEQMDLSGALRETARQMVGQKVIEIEVKTTGVVRPLAPTIEDNLLRVGQEAITNAFKYSDASTISIHVEFEPATVRLRVRDDGKGFDLAKTQESDGAHFGVLGMQERAKQIGARFTVTSAPGQGTEIVIEAASNGFAKPD